MSYLLRDNRKKDRGVVKIFGAFILLYLIYFFVGTFITESFHGVQRSVATFFGYYDDPVRPISENSLIKELRGENTQLKLLLGRTENSNEATTTNKVLEATSTSATSTKPIKVKALKKLNTPDSTMVLGVILSRPPRTPYDSLIIDIGEDEGLLEGDLVYAERNFVIGEVAEVYAASSIVKLFSSPDQKVDVLIGSSTTPVIAEGRGGGNFYIKIPKNINVTEGDQIVAPGIREHVFGTAEQVETDDAEAYSHVYFKLPVNIYSLHYVQIKKNPR